MWSAISHPCFYHATINITLQDGSKFVKDRTGRVTVHLPRLIPCHFISTLEVLVSEEGYPRLNEDNIIDIFQECGVEISQERVQLYRVNMVTNAITDGNSISDLLV